MVHNHWKSLKPMVEWPQHHRKTIESIGHGQQLRLVGSAMATEFQIFCDSKGHISIVWCIDIVCGQWLSIRNRRDHSSLLGGIYSLISWAYFSYFKKVWFLFMVCHSLLNSSFVLEYTSFLIILSRDGLSCFSILFSLLKIQAQCAHGVARGMRLAMTCACAWQC